MEEKRKLKFFPIENLPDPNTLDKGTLVLVVAKGNQHVYAVANVQWKDSPKTKLYMDDENGFTHNSIIYNSKVQNPKGISTYYSIIGILENNKENIF